MFGLGKKDQKKEASCCCEENYLPETMAKAELVKDGKGIKVLGGGCARCHELQSNTVAALQELGMNIPVELITDYSVIASYGVMSVPALVVNGKVVSYGKVLKQAEVASILKENL